MNGYNYFIITVTNITMKYLKAEISLQVFHRNCVPFYWKYFIVINMERAGRFQIEIQTSIAHKCQTAGVLTEEAGVPHTLFEIALRKLFSN